MELEKLEARARAPLGTEVASLVAPSAEVYVDGGLRRGVDVVRALALGARAAMVARPVVWGLATGGADLVLAMRLCGAPTLADCSGDLLAR